MFRNNCQNLSRAICFAWLVGLSCSIEAEPYWYLDYPDRAVHPMTGVWGADAEHVFATSSDGSILFFDGSEWTAMNSGTQSWLSDVWGTSATNVFVVGNEGTILKYDGTNWRRLFSRTTEWLAGIHGIGSDNCIAVGHNGIILKFNGTRWSIMSSPVTEHYSDIWCLAENLAYAITEQGSIVRFDGVQWIRLEVPECEGRYLTQLWASGPDNIYVVGPDCFLHYDGAAWTSIALNFDDKSFQPTCISGLGADELIIAGIGVSAVARYGGGQWQRLTANFYVNFSSIWIPSVGSPLAAGPYGLYRYDGERWIDIQDGEGQDLEAIHGTGLEDIYAVGVGRIMHFDGVSWKRSNVDFFDNFSCVYAARPDSVYVGSNGNGRIYHFDGHAWNILTEEVMADRVFGRNDNEIYFMHGSGVITRYDGNQWTYLLDDVSFGDVKESAGFARDEWMWLSDIWGTGPDNLYATIDSNVARLLHYNGEDWQLMSIGLPEGSWLKSIWGFGADRIYVSGGTPDGSNFVYRYDGSSWSPLPNVPGGGGTIWGTAPDDLYLVDYQMLYFDGSLWNSMYFASSPREIRDVWGKGPGRVYAVGRGGTIIYWDERKDVYVVPGFCSGSPGELVDLPVKIFQSLPVGHFQLDLQFDAHAIVFDSITVSESLTQNFTNVSASLVAPGALHVEATAGNAAPFAGSGTILYVKFRIADGAEENRYPVRIVNESGDMKGFRINEGGIVVKTSDWSTVYENDFERSDTPGSEWLNYTTATHTSLVKCVTAPLTGDRFIGLQSTQRLNITLDALPSHQMLSLAFDLFILRSWDGNSLTWGPDRWVLSVDGGPTLLSTSFSNEAESMQSFTGHYPESEFLSRSGAAEINTLGFQFREVVQDSVYKMYYVFPHTENRVSIDFQAIITQDVEDECWGLDDVDIRILPEMVPVEEYILY